MESQVTKSRIEVLVFDAMFTLILAKESRRKLLAKIFTRTVRKGSVSPRRLWRVTQRVRQEPPLMREDSYSRAWERINSRIIAELCGVPESEETRRMGLSIHHQVLSDASLYRVDREILDMLAFAGKNFRLAIASNQLEEFLRPMLKRFGIAGHFEQVICTDTIGCSKPDPDFFRKVYERLEVSPSAACYVGNSIRNDMPATYVGSRLVLLDRENELRPQENGGGLMGVIIVRSTAQLRRWIADQARAAATEPASSGADRG